MIGTGGTAGMGGMGGTGGCEPLALELRQMEIAAQKCEPESPPGTQCKEIIEGLCCPLAVNDMNSAEVQAYLEALQRYQQNGCMAMCPPDPCPVAANAKCVYGSTGPSCGAP